MNKKLRIFLEVFLPLLLISIVGYIVISSPYKEFLNLEKLSAFVNNIGIFGPIIFVLVYILCLLIFIPSSFFIISSGFLFGFWVGIISIVIGGTIAASLGFLIARKFSSKWDYFSKGEFTQSIISKCENYCEKEGFQVFFILRLLYLPYMPVSYATGMIKTAKFKDITLASFFGKIVSSVSFVYFGSQLNYGYKAIIFPVVLIILTLFVPRLIKKYKKNNFISKVVEK